MLWLEYAFLSFNKSKLGCGEHCIQEAGKSQRLADLVFLDGDHSEAGVLPDLEGYWPLVHGNGGIVAIHDFGMALFTGVVTATLRFFATKYDEGELFSRHVGSDFLLWAE